MKNALALFLILAISLPQVLRAEVPSEKAPPRYQPPEISADNEIDHEAATAPSTDSESIRTQTEMRGQTGPRKPAEISSSIPLPTEILRQRPNTVSMEILGRGGLYSFNYDRLVWRGLGAGVGFSYYSVGIPFISTNDFRVKAVVVPVYVQYFFSSGVHRPYVSAGLSLVNGEFKFQESSFLEDVADNQTVLTFSAGYEFRGAGGFLFRAAPYLITGPVTFLWLGSSVGLAF